MQTTTLLSEQKLPAVMQAGSVTQTHLVPLQL
jgi:hypothetical protein